VQPADEREGRYVWLSACFEDEAVCSGRLAGLGEKVQGFSYELVEVRAVVLD